MNKSSLRVYVIIISIMMIISFATCVMLLTGDYEKYSYSRNSEIYKNYQVRKYGGFVIKKNR